MNLLKQANILKRLAPALAGMALTLGACNSEKSDEPAYEPALSVAVQSFSISPNAKVMTNLDSVFFSIDLAHGVIFNADSLPQGTKINKLVPKITFPSAVTKAEIEMTGGETRTGVVDYKKSPTDSIDFSGNVTLTLATEDGSLSKRYTIKVNVHKMVADSIMWDRSAVAPLPSASPAPREQRTVALDDKVYSLIEESDGSYTMASTSDLLASSWNRTSLSLPFTPQPRSLTATSDRLYILADDGALYSSADGIDWKSCGASMSAIIGPFGERVLGLKYDGGRYYHDMYPRPEGYVPALAAADFPTSGMSNFISFTSKWASDPIGFFTGGARDGKYCGDSWAFDGDSWAKISNTPLPPVRDMLIVPYFNYRQTATSWVQTEFSVTLAIGGRLADGSLNRTVYLSYDNGVNWIKGESLIQLPSYIPSLYAADAVIQTSPMNASLADNWTARDPRLPHDVKRLQYFVDGNDIDWDCPYIYLFGGHTSDAALNAAIWRAVLARLTFTPIF